jgi:Zn-dependent M28 family amino/carboxypeptidase
MRTTKAKLASVLTLALLGALLAVGVASAAPGDEDPTMDTTAELRRAVEPASILVHERRFQQIADANGGTRVAGSPGYEASVRYVAGKLRDAGYEVRIQNFTFDAFEQRTDSVFERISPDPETYTEGVDEDFLTTEYSGSGDVTAPLVPAGGIIIPSPGGSMSGCSANHFADFPEGSVALVQRGTCTFRQKAQNAQEAGAVGVVIFNEGNEDPADDRLGPISGTLNPPQFSLPVIATSYAVGQELYNLAQQGDVRVHLKVDADVVTTPGTNVLANTRQGRADRTIVVGAHLDSVEEGPGINDNGSGTSTILEVALQMSKLGIKPNNRVRFAFWGAEEAGLIGSEHYVESLSNNQLDQIALNLNFDMLGSPNFVRFVYDGDGSATPDDESDDGPTGSGKIERVFKRYFAAKGLPTEPTAFDGRSDYGPFIAVGIPAGGLFSGAEGIKTARQEDVYGGTSGEPYDPCYHEACDDITNLSITALNQMSDAVAHATLTYAEDREVFVGASSVEAGRSKMYDGYKGPFARR